MTDARTSSPSPALRESDPCPDCIWIGEGDDARLAKYCLACADTADQMIEWLAGARA